MLRSGIIDLCKKQFALDYNCAPHDFDNKATLITAPRAWPGQRRYATGTSALSILSFNGKLVICADERLADWCRDVLAHRMSAEWGFNPGTLRAIDKKLSEFGWQIASARLYLTPCDSFRAAEPGLRFEQLTPRQIADFESDGRVDEAFVYDDYVSNALGMALYDARGEMCAVAGATDNGEYLWELGINSFSDGHGYGAALIAEMSRKVMDMGKVPFYNTELSHMASLRVALKAGFAPGFCELRSEVI